MRKKQADTDQNLLQEDAKVPFRGLGVTIATCLAVAVAVGYLVWAACAFGDRQRAVMCTDLEMTFLDGGEYHLVDSTYVKHYLAADGLNPVGRKRGEIRTEQMEAGLRGSEVRQVGGMLPQPVRGGAHAGAAAHAEIPRDGGCRRLLRRCRPPRAAPPPPATRPPGGGGGGPPEMAIGPLFDFVCFLEENDFWNAQIEQIYVRPDHKVELVPRVGDGIILLGTLDGYEQRLAKLKKPLHRGFQ